MKHPHYEVIMEWAADTSKVVQVFDQNDNEWIDIPGDAPAWYSDMEYRIKPAKKPDIVCEGLFGVYDNGFLCYHVSSSGKPNARFTFDGETRELIKVEKI